MASSSYLYPASATHTSLRTCSTRSRPYRLQATIDQGHTTCYLDQYSTCRFLCLPPLSHSSRVTLRCLPTSQGKQQQSPAQATSCHVKEQRTTFDPRHRIIKTARERIKPLAHRPCFSYARLPYRAASAIQERQRGLWPPRTPFGDPTIYNSFSIL